MGRLFLAMVAMLTRRSWPARIALLAPGALTFYYFLQPESIPWLGWSILGLALLAIPAVWLTVNPRPRSAGWLALAVGGLAFAVYLRTLSPTTDVADSLEFEVVAHFLRFAHRPGYPLYIMLGKLFTLLPFHDIAWRMNLFSATAAAAAIAVLYLVALALTERPAAALAGSLALAFSPAWWSQAVITEVYALNGLLVALVLLAIVIWTLAAKDVEAANEASEANAADDPDDAADAEEAVDATEAEDVKGAVDAEKADGTRPLGWLLVAAFAFGLGTMHHVTIVFLGPMFAGAVLWNAPRLLVRPRKLAAVALAFALGLTPVVYFFVRWPVLEGRPATVVEVFEYVTARSYTGLFQADWPLRDPSRIWMYGAELAAQFDGVALAIAGLGLLWLAWRRRQWAVWLAVTYALYVVFRIGYNAWDGWVVVAPAHLVVALMLAAGLRAVGDGVVAVLRKVEPWQAARIGMRVQARVSENADASTDRWTLASHWILVLGWTLALLIPVIQLWRNGPASDKSGGWPGLALGREALAQPMPQGASIVVDPQLGSALLYQQLLEGVRPDIRVGYADTATGRRMLNSPADEPGPVYLLGVTPDDTDGKHLRSLGPLIELGLEPQREAGPIRHPVALPALGPAGRLELLGYGLDLPVDAAIAPGKDVGVTLHWRATERMQEDMAVRLRLVHKGRAPVAETTGRPVAGWSSTADWSAGEVVTDFHRLRVDPTAWPGTYDLEVALGDAVTGATVVDWQRIGELAVGPAGAELAAHADMPLDVDWGPVRLLGYDAPRQVRPGDAVELVLYWQRARTQPFGLTVQVYAGMVSQGEAQLPDASAWATGQVVATRHAFRVPANARAEPLPIGLLVRESYWILGYHFAKDLRLLTWSLPPVVTTVNVRTALIGLDAPLPFADGIRLVGYEAPRVLRLGQDRRIWVRLGWEAYRRPARRYKLSVQLLDAEGHRRANTDREVLHGTRPTDTWRQGEIFRDLVPLDLPADLQPGGYRIQISFYDKQDETPLAVVDPVSGKAVDTRLVFGLVAVPAEPAQPSPAVLADFGGEIALTDHTIDPPTVRPGTTLRVTLRWIARSAPRRDYTLFAHLLRVDAKDSVESETLVAQADGQPFDGSFGTRLWPLGIPIATETTIEVPADAPAGHYRLAVGWYDLATGERLGVTGGSDRFVIDLGEGGAADNSR